MTNITTIQVHKETLKLLKKAKEYKRQSYAELVDKMVQTFLKSQKKDSYDAFLFKVQQQKMKELWDNKFDEAWDHV